MISNDAEQERSAESQPLGFVAVLDPAGRAEATLKAILPTLAAGDYLTSTTETLAVAADASRQSISVSRNEGRDVILLGNMVSEMVEADATLDWAVSAVENGRYADLKLLQGVFALIIVNSVARTITVVSDLIGIKPVYVAVRQGATILSDRAEAAPRLGGASIDPLGMAAWLYFNYPLVNRTMFESVSRIAPASVTVFRPQSSSQEIFWKPTVEEESISAERLADGIYQEFSDSLRRLLRPHGQATVPLSGGFDSRLCLLTALRERMVSLDAVTVPFNQAEREIVDSLVNMTGIECRRLEHRRSLFDEFDSIWYSSPDGYCRWRNISYLCAKYAGGSNPLIDGYHSDTSLRSTNAGPDPTGAVNREKAIEYVWKKHRHTNIEWCFRSSAIRRFQPLARQAMDEQNDAIEWSKKFCLQWDIQTDERRHMGAHHLQYDHFAQSIHPFYDRSLMERRLRYANEMFTKESYRELLKRHFPRAGGLPHAKDSPVKSSRKYVFSRRLWYQVPAATRFVCRHRDALRSHWILPRLLEYGLGRRSHMYVVLELMRFVKFEEEMNRFGIDLDFSKVFA